MPVNNVVIIQNFLASFTILVAGTTTCFYMFDQKVKKQNSSENVQALLVLKERKQKADEAFAVARAVRV